MRPTRWRRSTYVLVGVAVLAVVAALVLVGAVFTADGRSSTAAQALPPRPEPAVAEPALFAIGDVAAEPSRAKVTARLAPLVADPNLGRLTGRVTDAITGAEVWAQGAALPMQPASTNKVVTTAAALLALDRDATLQTTVLTDPDRPGLVVLKGGGDPTLSAAGPKTPTWYRNAARISDLADQVRKAGIRATAVEVDLSAYSGPTLAPGWDPLDIQYGDIAPMESVMLDGGRTQPVSHDSVRSFTPGLDAGRALAAALGVDPARVSQVVSPLRDGVQVASVTSPPLMERLRDMMNASDNVMAESIGREVAMAVGKPVSFDGAARAVLDEVGRAGIDTRGAVLRDGSGLSVDDRLTAETLDEVVTAAAGPDEPRLRPLVDLFPIAGGSGTLSNRYLNTDAAGLLRAKTGSLTGTNALAGIVTDASGRVLTFTFISNDAGPTGRTSLDALATALSTCGCGA
ncbi:D-alanyl-D-alanine carboxypeptidase/D-alanyl-D-alanine endopeptidase [Mycolicibacterium sediminis]|uniref:D-alanyl-D-alanine carboxypeptidase n=1 Tax=Mycolicibacterium sediminis TaxID=1286180 RepID=A0A7I7QIW8_9MYCO|nr:D-alanyl-D-alanine carboxypeptidase/D-alanyl-D-alanine-endopeptidase [Mycolicibacterium sediminis]BBY26214.1 D-alanyl-D-alanine carboxypeptidase [Mycolicibacterium sediminis]